MSPGSTRWRVRRWAALLMGVEAVMLAVAIAFGVIGQHQLADARTSVVDHLDPELLQAQSLTSALLDQESGLRGFLLTRQADFLQPFEDGRKQQAAAVAELRGLGVVGGTPAGDDLATVEADATTWQNTADQLINLGRPAGDAAVAAGKTQFDTVRTDLDRLRATLSGARDDERANLQNAATLLNTMIIMIIVLLVILFVLLPFGFYRTIVGPILNLAGEVRAVTDDIHRPVPAAGGPRELVELSADVEVMRQRIVSEVSELHRAHALLDERTHELERSNSDLEQFAYVASHDLQEPLRKVTSFCQLLQRRYQGKLDERADQYIEFAVDGAKRMQVLINDLLSFSRIGRRPAEHQSVVDTTELAGAAVSNLEPAIEDTGAEVSVESLPKVHGEASLLTTVFQNLISNAIKFHGEKPPRVWVNAERAGDEWTFSVTDNGIGIEPEYAERIFVIFQRLHTKNAYPGTGIGLALSRKIVEHHGGRIWLDTTAPAGQTRFRFTLPALPDESEEE
jgi:signal transduction histidine kinase